MINNGKMAQSCVLTKMRWGISPKLGSLLYNARSETILEKPTFSAPMNQGQRAIVLARLFNEGPKWFSVGGGAPFGMACVYNHTGFAIITAAANKKVEPYKHRMPAILPANMWSKWLTTSAQEAARLLKPLHPVHIQVAA
jgi:putative SOS response-associated peptidase YedK